MTIFISEDILLELATTLERAKFQQRLQTRSYTVSDLIAIAEELSQSCSTATVNVPQLRDPKDIKIIATAVAANAEVIVTGDLDLLVLERFSEIAIVSPQQFLSISESWRPDR
ncbi:putative toxin-antitoxin system toxin component, PIN family [Leptolyngbya sp. NK1-12]|uniref:putative toxin-antitoxin system toxin component, PIN family n=1 Tax=Leptolyngbya sp. NK1-12 TaxID=2547451 RepID=UPI002931072A|nr:putative toxin-antitoxin system toxin component, PIN family [Leptolyngbya sp. NK1-12]